MKISDVIFRNRLISVMSFIIISISLFATSLFISWNLDSLKEQSVKAIDTIKYNKWMAIEGYLTKSIDDNYQLSESLANKIIFDLKMYSDKDLQKGMNTIGESPNNIIQKIVGNHIKGVYFKGIQSDANDPFAMVIGKEGIEDSFLFADYSENCAVNQLTRTLDVEFELQNNKELAKVAFTKLLNLKYGKPIEESIFFQFESKEGVPLPTLDYEGIKASFFENNASFALTFKSIEFLAPYYIYRDKDIVGNARIEGRVRTNAKILAIVSVFSLYEVVLNDREFLSKLKEYDYNIKSLIELHIQQERSTLLTGILVVLLLLLSFSLMWGFHNIKRGINGEIDK